MLQVHFIVWYSVTSWAQELGRAGRDGNPATATVVAHQVFF